jgi:hypothetical protein
MCESASKVLLICVSCDCDATVTEVNILFLLHYRLNNLVEVGMFENENKWAMPLRLFF